LNLAEENKYLPNYRLTVKKKIPANLQHLITIFQTYAPGAKAAEKVRAEAETTNNYFGWGRLDLQYVPSDITVSSSLRTLKDGVPDDAPELKLSDNVVFDDEGGYNFDFGFAVPMKKISDVNIDYSNGTATPVNVNTLNVFMVVDGYIKKVDVKSSLWTNWPHPLAGIAFASQPLNKILVGGAWGPRFSELYLGAMFVKQPKRASGNSCSSSNTSGVVTGSYQFCTQFSIGLNLPVSGIASALSKPK
jgi:opacity protein-like surface antigen